MRIATIRRATAAILCSGALLCLLPMFMLSAAAVSVSTVVENVTVDIPGGSLAIKRIESSGKGSSGSDIVALFDRNDPKSLVARLRNFDAPSIVMPEVVAEYSLGEVKVRKVYRDVRLADVVQGRIGAASIGKIDILVTKGERSPIRGGIGRVTARNLDLVLLARLFLEPRDAGSETLGSLIDYVSMQSIDIEIPREVRFEVERLSLSHLGARALATPLLQLPGKMDELNRGPGSRSEHQSAMVHLLEDALKSWSVGSLEVRGVRIGLLRERTAYRLDRFAIADAAAPRIGEVAADGVFIGLGDATTKIGTMSLRGLDARVPLARLLDLLRQPPEDFRPDVRAQLPAFDRFLIERVTVAPRLRGSEFTPGDAAELMRLDHLEIAAENQVNGIPSALYGRIDGWKFATRLAARNDPIGMLGQFGYTALDVSAARFDLAWNAARRELTLDRLSADMPGIGSLEMTAALGGASPDLFSLEPATQVAAALGLRFLRLDAVFRNAGIVEKAMAYSAKDRDMKVEEVRAKAVQEATSEIPERLGGGRAARAIGDAVGRFLAQPQSLRLSATAPDGLGLADVPRLNGPGDVLDRLDVTASAN